MAAARKLLTIIWAMLTKNREYRYLREDLRKKKIRRMQRKALPYMVDKDFSRKISSVARGEEIVAETPQPAA